MKEIASEQARKKCLKQNAGSNCHVMLLFVLFLIFIIIITIITIIIIIIIFFFFSSHASTVRRISASGTPFNIPKNVRCSSTVRKSKRMSCCGHTPTPTSCRNRASAEVEVRSCPKAVREPEVGDRRPLNIFMVVLLPAPFDPSNARI